MSHPAPALPRLQWAERPKSAKCAGCGREPLCGFLSADRTLFYGACCYTDGHGDECRVFGVGRQGTGKPRLRTPEERERILRGIGK